MSKTDSHQFIGTKGSDYHKRKAYDKVKELIRNTPGAKTKAMAVGAYDEKTGICIATFAGAIPKKIHPKLKALAERVGGFGTLGVSERNTVGVCAEFHAVNQMLYAGCKLEDIKLTRAIRPRTGAVMPYCDNCRVMFAEIISRSG